jgi:molecular chaperone HscB
MDYFALLGLSPGFDMDMPALEAAYFKAQRQYHPDRFVGRPVAERQQALQRSMDINQAYHTLKSPLLLAQYLLHVQGITVGTEQDSVKPSPGVLMETMELREAIDTINDAAAWQATDDSLKVLAAQATQAVGGFYAKSEWPAMAQETLRLGYIIKAQDALASQKHRLGS